MIKGSNILWDQEVAVKLEKVGARHPQLEYEAKVYVYLLLWFMNHD